MLVLVLGILYSILTTNTRSYSSQENQVEMTQDLRAAMELLVPEVRGAGYDPTGIGGVGLQDDAGNDNYDTDGNSIHFTLDTDADGSIANAEDINYYLNGSNQIVRRTADGSEPVVAENVTSLTFLYGFADGATGVPDETDADTTNDLDDVRCVQVTIVGETANIDPITGAKKSRTQSSWVVVRNAGLL